MPEAGTWNRHNRSRIRSRLPSACSAYSRTETIPVLCAMTSPEVGACGQLSRARGGRAPASALVVPSEVSDFSPELTFKPDSPTVGTLTIIGRLSFQVELYLVALGWTGAPAQDWEFLNNLGVRVILQFVIHRDIWDKYLEIINLCHRVVLHFDAIV